MWKLLFTVIFLLFCILNVFISQAQIGKGAVSGVVRNPDKTLPAFLSVRLKNTKFSTLTNDDGYFQFLHVPNGSYVVEVSGNGFEILRQNIQVIDNQSIRLNLTINESTILLNEAQIKVYRALNSVGQM